MVTNGIELAGTSSRTEGRTLLLQLKSGQQVSGVLRPTRGMAHRLKKFYDQAREYKYHFLFLLQSIQITKSFHMANDSFSGFKSLLVVRRDRKFFSINQKPWATNS